MVPNPAHEDEAVTAAAQWIADQEPRQDVIPQIKTRFGLTSLQASEACALASKMRVYRKAHG
jgi:hypothetical protein